MWNDDVTWGEMDPCATCHMSPQFTLFTDLIFQLEHNTCLPSIGTFVISILYHMSSPGAWLFDLMVNGTPQVRNFRTRGDLRCYNVCSKWVESWSYMVGHKDFGTLELWEVYNVRMYSPKWSKAEATWKDLGSSGVRNFRRFRMLGCML